MKELELERGTKALFYSTVQKFTALFAAGLEIIEDDLGSGRQITKALRRKSAFTADHLIGPTCNL